MILWGGSFSIGFCVGVTAVDVVDVHGSAASLLFIMGAASHRACLHCCSAWERIHPFQAIERLHSGYAFIDVGRGSGSIVFGRGSGCFGSPSPISTVAVDGSCICPLQVFFGMGVTSGCGFIDVRCGSGAIVLSVLCCY